MSRRSIILVVLVIVTGAALWAGGQAIWNALLAMHGRGH